MIRDNIISDKSLFYRSANHELLNFLELMHAENAPRLLAVCASLLAEAGRDTSVANGLVLLQVEPLTTVQGRNRLL